MGFLVKGRQGERDGTTEPNFLSIMYSGRVVEDHSEKLIKLLDHFIEHVHNKFNKYAIYFFFCELLNIVILVSQVTILQLHISV